MSSELSWDPSRMEFKPVSMKITYEGGMRFTAENQNGVTIPIDAHVHLGGGGITPNPIDYLFASLGGCIGIKILLDLSDKGIKPESLEISTIATRRQTLPPIFEKVHHVITIKGALNDEILADTLEKTMKILCPVAVIFGETSEMTWEVRINT